MTALSPVITLLLAFAGGIALAAVYFRLVARSVADLRSGGSPVRTVGLGLLRLVAAAAFFWAAATQGVMVLLFALAGFVASRLVLLRRIARSLT